MKTKVSLLFVLVFPLAIPPAIGAEISLQTAPPVVVKTVPVAGSTNVDPTITEITVTYSKPMWDGSWSWSTWGEETFPEMTGKPKYLPDGRTCVLPVKLQPGRFYATWLNSDKFKNFKDAEGRPAVPYLLTFRTSGEAKEAAPEAVKSESAASELPLNADQRLILEWTDRQFRGFFDARSFEGWSDAERAELEARLIDALKGPRSRDYYQAINSLGALRSEKAVQPLLEIAAERREKDNRDRWMAIRALGMIGDKSVVPELIHLVYHGNLNTRWWAQIALVQLTGENFAKDWKQWGEWWNEKRGEPPFKDEMVQWYSDPNFSDPAKLGETLRENDSKFFERLKGAAPTPTPADAPGAGSR